ncbi:hypothetical protein BWD42_04125 [Sphingobacterium sp. CZ-UAM]|uniref:hypothetical protein n=1 Tax=Sphingobacterium sp. CZ-UAM TaxID=1933868 RepID=UPI000984A466|nr:hypothetical protein [Sphingobacterium sp. CZ-UAM]OOG19145.1 hypothetical protein BWD42_04125 [Sphingobacterium sp. CZ-UAM]
MNDILKSINLRLRNPFILSFSISWIFLNWRIVVGLLWYNSTTIEKLGYKNYYDLINANLDAASFQIPLFVAMMYPILMWGIRLFQTFIEKYEVKSIKRVSKDGYIKTERYLKLTEKYDESVGRLSDLINSEAVIQNENTSLKEKNIELKSSLDASSKSRGEIESEMKALKIKSSLKIFNSEWEVTIRDKFSKDEFINTMIINDGKFAWVNPYDDERVKMFEIIYYVFNIETSTCTLILNVLNNVFSTKIITLNFLKWEDESRRLVSYVPEDSQISDSFELTMVRRIHTP